MNKELIACYVGLGISADGGIYGLKRGNITIRLLSTTDKEWVLLYKQTAEKLGLKVNFHSLGKKIGIGKKDTWAITLSTRQLKELVFLLDYPQYFKQDKYNKLKKAFEIKGLI